MSCSAKFKDPTTGGESEDNRQLKSALKAIERRRINSLQILTFDTRDVVVDIKMIAVMARFYIDI